MPSLVISLIMKVEFKPDEFNLLLKFLEGQDLTTDEKMTGWDLAQKLREQKKSFASKMLEDIQRSDARAAENALKEPPR